MKKYNKKPEKISVLLTVFNEQEFINSSVKSILNQSYNNFEFIIIDDYSNDNTFKILKKIRDKRIKLYRLKKKLGRTKALNYGLKKCNSNYIAIQDADDLSFKNRLKTQICQFSKDPTLGLLASRAIYTNDDNIKIENSKIYFSKNLNKLKFRNFITHSSVMFKKNAIYKKNFLYDESYVYAQDYKMILTFLKLSKIFVLKKPLVKIRINRRRGMTVNEGLKLLIVKESISLLKFAKKNFKNNLEETISINLYLLRKYAKLSILFVQKFYGIFWKNS
tara:strand:+ start:534 stop:1364 length:831 start_codon:yes stop_codon:yes gene_type:complete